MALMKRGCFIHFDTLFRSAAVLDAHAECFRSTWSWLNSQFTLATSPAVVIVVSFAIDSVIGNVIDVTANKSPENRLNIR
jgi:hypothetical protein